jgi:glycosyltransferase involved in cell wall biosynthesis
MAAALRDAGVNARYAVVGHDAGDRAEAERRVGELGLSDAFVFAGGVAADGVEQWYDDADVYVLPAVDEPFPLTVLEALRAGVPTVVTDGCFIAAELERAQAAIVASPTAGSLAGAVTSILRDEALARRLGANGQAAVERQFRLGAVADRLLDLYEEIAR